ncbi:MAG: hypothetical protein H6766_05255 [Candidatus Peribacteria bacterium]|nr:MAG: hypothetical protein H6766_05255 [Candidatus Peribacteria bacterium]
MLVAAIVYLLYGLQLAFIPYSTAWDANHAYMFFPKIWADHHGLYWSDGPWTPPFIRYSYIAQWFSSMSWLTPITGIARDTMAVIMNFVTSAVGILVVGAALLDTVARWFTKHKESATTFSLISGAMLLLWLTSGMGAFLVFVDNKTDLGILLLVMVALLSAFMFLTHIDENTDQTPSPTRYAMMSGFFFGVAFLGKPTAFIDIAGFVTMVIGTQLGIL